MGKQAFLPRQHNHRHCVEQAVAQARAICQRQGSRLTPQRQQVLELIWQEHRPVGAYELLERMRELGHKAAPPTVYRALEFLQANGLIHRIESLNAFTGCPHPDHPHQGQFLVCTQCRRVAELEMSEISHQLDKAAARAGFHSQQQTIELSGICAECHQVADGH
jgi:Fur family zinc uptake transcriptional regulator